MAIGLSAVSADVSAQKTISEGVLVYTMEIRSVNANNQTNEALGGSSTTIYLKGNNSRKELVTPLGKEYIIHDAKSGNAVILKEFSGQKLMIKLSKEDWFERNKADTGINFEETAETRVIAGHSCKKAIAKMSNGKTFDVFYVTDTLVANKEYDPTFSRLPGLAVQYEIEAGNMKFKYTLSRANNEAVQAQKFDFPRSGYRVMTYKENQQLKNGNQ
jgi:GLPGLI family protein